MTPTGTMILQLINESKAHFTAEEIYLKLKERSSTAVLATVYNNLNGLLRQGLIRRVSVEGCPDRYDRIVRHDHLLCTKCGRLADITLEDLTAQLQAQIGDTILSYDLKINYVCPECRQSADTSKATSPDMA